MKFYKQTDIKYYIKAFVLAALAGLLFVVPFSIKSGGIYYLGSDFVEQQIPFITYCNQAIKDGNIFWAPTIDLGTSFIGAFSFYVIGSPFFWLSLLFKAENYYLLAGAFLVLKMAVACTTAFAYIKQYVRNYNWAIIAGLLYAFCGYQISNMNFNHFYDVTALFPLMLLALDKTVENNKKGWFCLSVALLAVCNAVFFVGEVVFLILYFTVKVYSKTYKINLKKLIQLAVESILGVGLSAFLLLPTVLVLINNPRVEDIGFQNIASMLFLKPIYWAELIRGALFPAECIFSRGFYLQGFTNGAELYLPVFGLILAAAYCFKYKKSWITKLTLACFVFAVIPVLNSSFVMFNAEYYTRWYYMPLLILCLASAKALDDAKISLASGYKFYGFLWLLLLAVFLAFTYFFKVTFIYNMIPVIFYVVVSLAGFAVALAVRKIQNHKRGAAALMAITVLFCALTGGFNTYYHQKQRTPQIVKDYYTVNEKIAMPKEEAGYRMFSKYYFMNLGTYMNYPTTTTFASSISPSLFRFYKACGIPRSVITTLPENQPGYQALLSAKYWVDYENETYTINTFQDAIPMGFVFEHYITPQEFQQVSDQEKDNVLLKALVMPHQQAENYKNVLTHLPIENLNATTEQDFKQDVENRKKYTADSFSYHNTGCTATITLEQEGMVFFSIPYEEGWSAKVNGKEVEIVPVDYAFMAVKANAGENLIQLSYWPKGLNLGMGITLGAAVLLAGYCLIPKYKNKKTIKK